MNKLRLVIVFISMLLISHFDIHKIESQDQNRMGYIWSIQTITNEVLIDPITSGVSPDGSFVRTFKCGIHTSWNELREDIQDGDIAALMPPGYVLGVVQIGYTAVIFSSHTVAGEVTENYGYKGRGFIEILHSEWVTDVMWIDKPALNSLWSEYNLVMSSEQDPQREVYITYIASDGRFYGKADNWQECFNVAPVDIYNQYFALPNKDHYLQYGEQKNGISGSGQDDRWIFNAQAGDKVHIEATGSSPRFTILTNRGVPLKNFAQASENAVIDYTFDSAGSYQIMIHSALGTSYTILLLADMPVPTAIPIAATVPTIAAVPLCPGSPSTRLFINVQAKVISNVLRIRKDPNAPTDRNIGMLANGDIVTILGGPQCGHNGLTFWYIQDSQGRIGWIGEGEGSDYYLAPAY